MAQKPKPPARNQPQRQTPGNVVIHHQKEYRGILPPPEMMEQYRIVVPDLPEKLVQMAEKEMNHRQGLEKKALGGQIWLEVSRIIAGLIALGGILLVAYLFMKDGHPNQAATVAGLAVAIVGVFITKRMFSKDSAKDN